MSILFLNYAPLTPLQYRGILEGRREATAEEMERIEREIESLSRDIEGQQAERPETEAPEAAT